MCNALCEIMSINWLKIAIRKHQPDTLCSTVDLSCDLQKMRETGQASGGRL